jgi:hypothetical protein
MGDEMMDDEWTSRHVERSAKVLVWTEGQTKTRKGAMAIIAASHGYATVGAICERAMR